jgi:hypothetical protein
MSARTYEIRYSPFNEKLLGLLGMGPRHSAVTVDDDTVEVSMGWAFHSTISRHAITSVAHDDDRVLGWGVHGWRGRWLVNGSTDGLVRFAIDPRTSARMCGLRVSLRLLRVSVVDADGLVAEFNPSAG